MEVLAGEVNFVTRQREYDCVFELNLKEVYWCSRLSTERHRVVERLPKDSVLCDMFCGVGPLSIQAAKYKNCKVLANDLNPECAVYLRKNIELNKLKHKILPFNMDAREFVRMIVAQSGVPLEYAHFDTVYMNLPVDAVEFLDVFCGLFASGSKAVWNEGNLPVIYVYAFTEQEKEAEAKAALCVRINKIFDKYKPLAVEDIIDFYQIRDVSAKSRMYSVAFKLSKEVAYGTVKEELKVPKKHSAEDEVPGPEEKKKKTE
eukprot:TRINITY_DN13372_c0_g2_i1.p1 TRINITY_DN13372_c0_g2~~TRINITY_DN13372_c0_g2_i1.p1  ORF type:complete len:260 (+),score=74.13 TRINITY_DN13372_c0_g2_i1:726-1505(+)